MGMVKRITAVIVLVVLGVGVAGIILVTLFPGVGARLARPLRALLGVQVVAQMEMALFTLQDGARQVGYGLGLAEAEAPWQLVPTRAATAVLPAVTPAAVAREGRGAREETPVPALLPSLTFTSPPPRFSTPTPSPWPPSPTPDQRPLPPVTPLGNLAGAGEWQPYLFDAAGNVVAWRTFLQPDETRPYAIVALVAFDLSQTSLHYVLGYEEPALPDGPRGAGVILAADRQPGRLLATFNGGFMASHGAYGAMANGLTALPLKEGYATVAITAAGEVLVGEWGSDIPVAGDYRALRQNARPVTRNGAINERVYNGSAVTWGSSIDGDVVTWRSALGVSADGQTLYFAAGPSLSMPALAEALLAAGVANSMLLDINESWTHFAAIRADGDELLAEPLMQGMEYRANRYLHPSDRDFFYVTAP